MGIAVVRWLLYNFLPGGELIAVQPQTYVSAIRTPNQADKISYLKDDFRYYTDLWLDLYSRREPLTFTRLAYEDQA